MPNRMERFTQRSRRVLSLAQEAAWSMGSASIDSDHLLIGLLNETDGAAAQALRAAGVDASGVGKFARQQIKARRKSDAQIDLSDDSKRTLELAVDEARRLGHSYIGTEHLLLGLLRLEDGAALDILRKMNISREQVRQQAIGFIQEQYKAPPAPERTRSSIRPALRSFDYFLLRMTSRSSGGVSHLAVDLAPAVKVALEKALKEVAHYGHLQLEERDLLLGLLQDPDGELRRLLLDTDVDLDKLVNQLRRPADD